ncbi:hypothetical protein EDD18DRAFT_1108388 [Armillaria luteobubalina]|uniref:Uncharacterized protein n=1 Tax=Armillaria luteobubalina TaxID=153913 RepID=A0AA39UQN5_9AGAR|nr:hypothetical protein EDD18DRAFT_1108388 [Armillaria luteobubalina]
MATLPTLMNFIRSGPYFIALRTSKSMIGFHCKQVALYIKHANNLSKGKLPPGWIEPTGYNIFTAAWNEEDVASSAFPLTIDNIFPPLPRKQKVGAQGSREGTPPIPGGHVLMQEEYATATRAVWEEASTSHHRKDHIAQGKHKRIHNREKRETWGIDNALSLHIHKPTFSLAPDKSQDGSNAIPDDALPGSRAMDTDSPAEA